jgi:hypothetical protein
VPEIRVNYTPTGTEVQISGEKAWWIDAVRDYFLSRGLLNEGDGDLDRHIQASIRRHISQFAFELDKRYGKK